jgi:type I restriction enzyme, S subunit
MITPWKTCLLADACELFADGDWIETKDQSSEGFRLIQTGNVGMGEFRDKEDRARFIDFTTFDRLNCQEVFPGDCLISRLPDPVGRACILPDTGQRMITAVDCTIIRFKKASILPQLFNYYAQSAGYLNEVSAKCTGATRQRISRKNLGTISVPLPPLAEQRRIVGILDEAFAGIARAVAATEKNLANARELFESSLNGIFDSRHESWASCRIGDLGTACTGSTPKTSQAENFGDRIPFIKPGDFAPDGTLNYQNEGLSDIGLKQSRLIPSGSLLMVCIGATIGKSAYSEADLTTNQQITSLTPKVGVRGKFLYYQSITSAFQRRMIANAGQTTLPIISKSKWCDLPVQIPSSTDEQDAIIQRLDGLSFQTQRLESLYRRKLAALSELKQSILQKAFAGELTGKELEEGAA